MARPRNIYIHKTVIEVGGRIEEGLPLPATPYIEAMLRAVLARAQSLYRVTVCHFIFMSNHFHMILVVEDPALVDDFFCFLKREISHAINRFLGRMQKTNWTKGARGTIILDVDKVIERIVYVYHNPSEDDLVDKIDEYPGLSSWDAFLSGGETITAGWIPRAEIPTLPGRTLSFREQELLAQRLRNNSTEENTLVIEPDAWMDCFPGCNSEDSVEKINAQIIQKLRLAEEDSRKKRKKPVLGAHALRLQSMRASWTPKKRSPKLICMASDIELRVSFLTWRKELCEQAEALRGESRYVHLPPGLFAPGGFLKANINPAFVPLH